MPAGFSPILLLHYLAQLGDNRINRYAEKTISKFCSSIHDSNVEISPIVEMTIMSNIFCTQLAVIYAARISRVVVDSPLDFVGIVSTYLQNWVIRVCGFAFLLLTHLAVLPGG